ncbi:MAG: hypothetical protein JXB46_03900 [Candidatus Eisenbacteria bacterium]|nr:hypothetical protein [Candidatus Eisenbacteria bacterium]
MSGTELALLIRMHDSRIVLIAVSGLMDFLPPRDLRESVFDRAFARPFDDIGFVEICRRLWRAVRHCGERYSFARSLWHP